MLMPALNLAFLDDTFNELMLVHFASFLLVLFFVFLYRAGRNVDACP
tara:strand:+ start:107 stop:247 length:141 start_codon:yes stop_codon:yes gene_type:complete